ncbi:MAG: hypothetical protein ACLUVC_02480 [Longibaculum sp.]
MKYKKIRLKNRVKKNLIVLLCLIICILCIHNVLGYIKNLNEELVDFSFPFPSINLTFPDIDIAKKGSIDVLALGNSDLFSAFNPLQLWNEKGITSYAAGGSMQNMSATYYMLEEIFKYQNPKVLILELDNFFETRGKDDKNEAKLNTYKTCFPLFRYTPLWKQLKNKSYVQKSLANSRTLLRGYYFKTEIMPNNQGYSYMGKNNDEKVEMVKYTKKYFHKIMSLTRRKNCKVIFLCLPSATSWNYQKHNTVAEYAKQYDVPYLDMNISDYGIGFDWKTDTRDAGNHLNHSGATKVTKFLGDYLKEHYDLIDHRGNTNFKDWEDDYQYFTTLLENKK